MMGPSLGWAGGRWRRWYCTLVAYCIDWKWEGIEETFILFSLFIIMQSVEKTRVVEECCLGYARTADNSSCVPICGQQCLHGTW